MPVLSFARLNLLHRVPTVSHVAKVHWQRLHAFGFRNRAIEFQQHSLGAGLIESHQVQLQRHSLGAGLSSTGSGSPPPTPHADDSVLACGECDSGGYSEGSKRIRGLSEGSQQNITKLVEWPMRGKVADEGQREGEVLGLGERHS